MDNYLDRLGTRRGVLRSAAAATALATASRIGAAPAASASQATPPAEPIGGTLNLLVQAGYDEPQIIQPFEEMYGVTVNSRVFPSSDEMFSTLLASQPGDWDVTMPDTPWIARLQEADLVEELNPADYPIQDQYDRWQQFDQLFVDDENRLRRVVADQ